MLFLYIFTLLNKGENTTPELCAIYLQNDANQ